MACAAILTVRDAIIPKKRGIRRDPGFPNKAHLSTMRIDPNEQIEGIALTEIRAAFREAGLDSIVSTEFIRRRFRLSWARAEGLITELRQLGFLKANSTRRPGRGDADEWGLTKDGIRLRAATAAKTIHRATADRLLSELLQRIELLNSDNRFLARVAKAVVFGSYLGKDDRIGDVDVAVQVVPREPDFEKHTKANSRRVAQEFARGRRFSNIVAQAFWWQSEAMLFLRNRKRALSLQDYSSIKKIVDACPHRIIYRASVRQSPPRRRSA